MAKKVEKRYDKGTNSKSDHIGELSPSISERRLTLSPCSFKWSYSPNYAIIILRLITSII